MAAWTPRANEIFVSALDFATPAERASHLDATCGSDADLRRQVEVLLAAHDRAGSFLERPAAANGTGAYTPDADDARSSESAVTEVPGTVIGPYKLLELLGEGGMGTVWMAQQTEPVKRLVAIKLIKAGMDSKQVIARFEAERQALALMDHPNIAKVLDAGTTGSEAEAQRGARHDSPRCASASSGRPYFVMELVKGIPITRFCDDRRLTPRQRLELFLPVCQAVQHAHQKGIIHRDLKPSNVLVALYDGKPVPKVIDFGVAKAAGQPLTDKTLVTGFGDIIGTLEYMSPEQAEINQLDVDTRSDIYSLGVLLYELLTGSPPFTKKDLTSAGLLESLRVIREQEPSKPSVKLSTAKGLPALAANRGTEPATLTKLLRGELDWIVMKALEKDRGRRYETANGFAQDLQRYLADERVLACPPSVRYRFGKFARRNKRALATMTVMAVAVLVTMAALVVSNVLITGALATAKASEKEAQDQERLAKEERRIAREQEKIAKFHEDVAKDNAVKAETEGRIAREQEKIAKQQEKIAKQEELTQRRRYYAAQMYLAMQAWETGDPARTLELLETQRPRFDEEDLRKFEWYYLWRLCNRGLRARLNHEADYVAFLPDAKTLASTGMGSFKVWEVSSGKEKLTWPVGHHGGLSVSPDGKLLGTSGQVEPTQLWDATSGQQVAIIEGTRAPTFSPDGKLMAVVRNGDIEFWDLATNWDLATKKPHSVLRVRERVGLPGWPGSFVFAPDGKTALARINNNQMRIYKLAGDQWQEGSGISGYGWSSPPAFSPDCDTIAMGGNDSKIHFYSADTGKEVSALPGHTAKVSAVAFSPDGKCLASAGGDRTVRLWDLETRKQHACYPHKGPVTSVAFSRDGKLLASAGTYEGPRIWDTAPSEVTSVLQHPDGVYFLAFTPDDTLVAAGYYPTQLWDVATKKATPLNSHTEKPFVLSLSPDGSTLADRTPEYTVKLLDLATGQDRGGFPGQTDVSRATFSPDGKTLATWNSGRGGLIVNLWDVATRKMRARLQARWPGSIRSVVFSPDSKTLVAGSGSHSVIAWDVTSTQQKMGIVLDLEHATTDSVAFSPDGKILATGSSNGMIRLWNVDSWKLQASLKGLTEAIRVMAFSPDGKTLAAASADKVRLWDVATGQELITLKGHTGEIRCMAFSRDGNTLATGSVDGTLRLWQAATDPQAKAFRTDLDADDPDSPAAFFEAAERLEDVGRAEEAKHAFEKAAEKASAQLEKLTGAFARGAGGSTKLAALAPYYNIRGKAYGKLGRWDKAAADLTKAIELVPDETSYWSDRGQAHLWMRKWDEAIADCSKAFELSFGNAWIFSVRGAAYAELEQWDKAQADFATAFERQKHNHQHSYYLALTLLRGGDVAAYRKLCAEVIGRFDSVAKTEGPTNYAVITCILAPDAVADWKVPLQLAEAALVQNPKSNSAHFLLGALLYRAGQFEQALQRLTEAERTYPPHDDKLHPIAINWIFLALTHQRLGHAAEAKKWHDKAAQWINQEVRTSKVAATGNPPRWSRRLFLPLLLRESEELLGKIDQ